MSCTLKFDTISKSAFTQSRKKLRPEVFKALIKHQLFYFESNAPNVKSWKGKRVVAIDGSLLNLPHSREIEQDFGSVKNQHEKIVSARCSFAYDVCNELVLDAKIDRRKSCEKELAVSHLDSLNPQTDILVFDRGYPCQWLIGLLMKRKFQFCIRLSTAWKEAVSLTQSQENDICWTLKRNSNRALGKIIEYDIPLELEGLRILKIPLSSGEIEVLATNILDKEAYDLKAMKELYNLRWGVEEGYKIFKKIVLIESFTGKSTLSVIQDFYAKIFMMNLSSLVRTQMLEEKREKHIMKPNKTQVIAKVKDFLTEIFYKNEIEEVLIQLKKMLIKCYEVVRPNRSFIRTESSSRRRHKHLVHKGI